MQLNSKLVLLLIYNIGVEMVARNVEVVACVCSVCVVAEMQSVCSVVGCTVAAKLKADGSMRG